LAKFKIKLYDLSGCFCECQELFDIQSNFD